jgi:surface antigen
MTLRALAITGLLSLALAGCATGPAPVKPTAGDLERLRAAEQEALENAKTGQSVNWDNPRTGHSGSVTVLETVTAEETEAGQPCRRIQRVFSADGTTRTGTAYACRTVSGDWTIEREERLLTREQRVQAERRPPPYFYYGPYGPRYYGHPLHPFHHRHFHDRHRDGSGGLRIGAGVTFVH